MNATKVKHDVPVSHLDYSYIEKCQDVKELEKIVKILRSGKEGKYPDLEATAEKKLALLNPKSKALRKDQPILQTRDLSKEEQKNIFADIENWSDEIKNLETGLQHTNSSGSIVDGALPPVRGAGNIAVEKGGGADQTKKSSSKRVKPRDYKEWDKIDVDAELEKLDQEEKQDEKKGGGGVTGVSGGGLRSTPNIPDTVPLAGLTDDEKRIKAEKEKDKGNEAFKSGDYNEAVLYYTRSLSLTSNTASRNNRAQAYLKLEKWDKAISDVEVVLSVEPNNVKAILRRAVGYQGKRMLLESKTDLEKVLELEPNNKRAQTVLEEVETALKEQKVKGRRMVIEETDGSTEDESDNDTECVKVDIPKTESQPKEVKVKDTEEQQENIEPPTHTDKPSIKPIEVTDSSSSVGISQRSESETGVSESKEDTGVVESKGGSGDSSEQAREMSKVQPPPPLPQAVVKLKDTGNEYFKAGRYAEAITKYTNAINKIQSDPCHHVSLSVLYSNRAACKQKTGDCAGCIEDANRALDLNPGAVKPLLRRATAYETMEKYRHAYVDFKQITLIDRSAEIAQQGANRCQTALQEADGLKWREKLPAMSPMPTAHSPLFPTVTAPSNAAQKPSEKMPTGDGKTVGSSSTVGRGNRENGNMSDAEKLDLFNSEKDKGNGFVKKGDFKAAVKCYTKCIELCPEQSVAYTNRALCYIRMDKPSEVVRDCDRALEHEPENVKALFRKAQGCKMLKQYRDSQSLLEKVLSLDRSNTAAKREVHVVKKYILEEEAKRKKAEPRKKITIQEVSSDESESESEGHSEAEGQGPSKGQGEASVEKNLIQEPAAKTTAKEKPMTKTSPVTTTVSGTNPPAQQQTKDNTATKGDSRAKEAAGSKSSGEAKTTSEAQNQLGGMSQKAPKSSSKIRPTAGLMGSSAAAVTLDKATPFEFVSAWTALKTSGTVDQYLSLLQQVQPEKLASVISNKLEGNMLYTIIQCAAELVNSGKAGLGYSYLYHLTNVPRFEMNTMFMSSVEKKELKKVLDKLQKTQDDGYSKADLKELGRRYGM